jgi:hypothetical protein
VLCFLPQKDTQQHAVLAQREMEKKRSPLV